MDLNYLLMREQVERVRADRAACAASRACHSALADDYRGLLDDHRRRRIAAAAPTALHAPHP